jgi:hypothetical protein
MTLQINLHKMMQDMYQQKLCYNFFNVIFRNFEGLALLREAKG